jgi:REP element-mobilizing transposase RayT
MKLSDAGIIVSDYFTEIPTYHKRIVLDEWIVMPNHFHCIMQMSKQVNIINKFQTSIIKTCPYEAKQVRMDG